MSFEENALSNTSLVDERAKVMLQSAASGNAEAQFQIALCYQLGLGAPTNVNEATKWYKAAAKQGHQRASTQLFRLNASYMMMKTELAEAIIHRAPISVEERTKDFIGLEHVKEQLAAYMNILKFNDLRAHHGFDGQVVNTNMVFTGNPGTGKTSMARLLGDLLKDAGLLEKGHVVETSPTDLCSQSSYVASEVIELRKRMEKAQGGILFIDEAHNFPQHSASNTEYWRNVITELVSEMTSVKGCNFSVILAGYKEGIDHVFMLEPGLKSRFQTFIHFPDYNNTELVAIFEKYATDMQFSLAEGCREMLVKAMNDMPNRLAKNFGNARYVRNFVDDVVKCVAERVTRMASPTRTDISTITVFDVKAALKKRDQK